MKLIILAIFCSIAALTRADYWGTFRQDKCVGDGLRLFSAILYGIPRGESWEDHCANGPKVTLYGQVFDRPTKCYNRGPGIHMIGQFHVMDQTCLNLGNSGLFQGYELRVGAIRTSPLGRFILKMQGDGNLVLYRKSDNKAIWYTNTANSGATKAMMQFDGNFVVYTASNENKWMSGTNGRPMNYLKVQDDGDLVIYTMGTTNAQWSSNTNGYKTQTTNLRTESPDSTSVVDTGAMTIQEALPDTFVDIVHFDHDPNSAGDAAVAVGAPDEASNRTLDGVN